ncbi:MAG TPA: PEP-CTERM sorting domain-containing protein [Verrucomicrobiae bacterium]|nr:PEP-CTERM sorting domain-containing protein [Verrucomicrobiae bacterium]
MTFKRAVRYSAAAIALAAATTPVSSAPFAGSAREDFNYPAGTAITTTTALNGGTGWNPAGNSGQANTTSWGATVPNNASGNGISVAAGSLSYAGLLTSGGRALVDATGATTAIGRLFGENVDSGTFYFSFLMSKTVETERTLNVSFFSHADGTGTPNERFAIGQIGGGANDSDGNFAVLVSNSGTDNGLRLAATPIDLGLDTAHLVVGRLDFNVSGITDRLSLFIDPSLDAEPATPYLTVETDFQVLRGFRMFAGGSSAPFTPAAQGAFDEFNFGTSWAAVTPVPEPGTFTILGFGVFALLAMRRRN